MPKFKVHLISLMVETSEAEVEVEAATMDEAIQAAINFDIIDWGRDHLLFSGRDVLEVQHDNGEVIFKGDYDDAVNAFLRELA